MKAEIEEKQENPVLVESQSDNDIELKPKKEKKPYVLTEARKAQFEKARIKRNENIQIRKIEKEESTKEYLDKKKELQQKKDETLKKKHTKELIQLQQELDKENAILGEDEIIDEEIIVKRKPKQRKKIIYIDSDDDEEDDSNKKNKIIINNIYKGEEVKKKEIPPKRIINFL